MTSNLTAPWRRRLREPAWAAMTALARPTAGRRPLPDFLVVGAQRAGTTSLMRLLAEHPDITTPRFMKGVHFFDTAYDRGEYWYRAHFPTGEARGRHARKTGHELLVGEASPYYLFHPAVPSRIADLMPTVKIVALLRDPVERAISHHKHEVRRGVESLGLAEALEAEAARLEGEEARLLANPAATSPAHQHFSYVTRGRYAEQLSRYQARFPREQLMVMESEALFSEPATPFAELLRFLGAAPWEPSGFPHVNATPDASVPAAVRDRLEAEFEGPNAELERVAGRTFSWT